MKNLLILLVLIVTWSVCLVAQPEVKTLRDSSGTATVYWQRIDTKSTLAKNVECINDGAVDLYFTIRSADTVTTSGSAYRIVKPGNTLPIVNTKSRYFFIRAASGTCAYRVGTF